MNEDLKDNGDRIRCFFYPIEEKKTEFYNFVKKLTNNRAMETVSLQVVQGRNISV